MIIFVHFYFPFSVHCYIIIYNSQKNLRSSFGDVDLDILRDRKAEFEPQIIKKYETVCNELDKKNNFPLCQRNAY